MLETVLATMNNWFETDRIAGEYTVSDGALSLPFLKYGQYFRVKGSIMNDGVYKYPASDMVDETFDGEIWPLIVPKAVVSLAEEVAEWREANPDSVYTSESFGGYSYSKNLSADGTPMTWRDVFSHELNRWRKL